MLDPASRATPISQSYRITLGRGPERSAISASRRTCPASASRPLLYALISRPDRVHELRSPHGSPLDHHYQHVRREGSEAGTPTWCGVRHELARPPPYAGRRGLGM